MKALNLKFEVGDWVVDIQDGALYKIKEIKEFPEEPTYKRFIFSSTEETWIDIYNDEVDTNGWELWQPITGEWCWVFNYLREVPNLRRVIKVEDNFNNRFDDEKFTKAVRVNRGDDLNDEVGYRFCEPFIGQLPTILGL